MKIGFTGSQLGMTERQRREFEDYLQQSLQIATAKFYQNHFHHGDCIGADYQAHWIVCGKMVIHVHPPVDKKKAAGLSGHYRWPAKEYLLRNRDIVDACDLLIAAPSGPEKLRSGTWSTVRYARKVGKPVHILLP